MPAHLELMIFGLLVAVVGFVLLSSFSRVPYPIFLVVGGLVLSLIPGLPAIELPPELVFLIFLPPLLYSSAFFSSPRDIKAQLRPIALLSLGLVLFTTVAVAVVGHMAIGLPWSVAFVLGVVVSPTDPVTVASTAERLGLPRNLITILEGESLINDGTALALYRTAVAAVVAGSFSIFETGLDFVLSGIGGVAIGLAVGWVISRVRSWVEDPLVETTIALFTGYAAYLPAEELKASGVLAVVAAGLYLSWQSPQMTSPRNRLQVFEVVWVEDFLLNSVLFVLVGLQLPTISSGLSDQPTAVLPLYGVLVSSAVIGTRLVWTFPMAYLPHRLSRRIRERNPFPPWQQVAFVAYAGMRGGVSLAAALSLPLTMGSGAPFPDRDLVIFLAFCVILVTLVLQGLSLPFLVRRLGLDEDDEEEREENEARLRAAEAALARIEELEDEEWVREDTAERMRRFYDYRRRRFAALYAGESEDDDEEDGYEQRSMAYQRLRRELLSAEREALLQLRNEGRISDSVRGRVERDLDLEDARLEI